MTTLRITTLIFGFMLSLVGCIYMITYLNLMTVGYNFIEYVNFITRRVECILFFVGMILILGSIYLPGGEIYELHL